MKWLVALTFLLSAPVLAREIDIEVVGLFKGAAMLVIDGDQRLLKTGEQTPEGIRLVSADSHEAIVEIGGERRTLDLSTRISSQFEVPDKVTVSIGLNNIGQYRTTGSINGRPVAFVVDTGANVMAMNAAMAKSLGIDYDGRRPKRAVTAGGVVNSWDVTLDRVDVGQISVPNVKAAVLEGDYPRDVLLGMTFLRNVRMHEGPEVLLLESKVN
ncbi:MAG: retroviral-like aspartic protease family protein [Pseudomonadales bacterium]|nr:retroviral-like aspartic protease family protein [Pseudomonadales bacterium]